MSDTVISIENVSKYYRLGLIGSGTIREDVQRWWHRIRGKPDPTRKVDQPVGGEAAAGASPDGAIWALRDVSLQVRRGEIVGIIGGNGAGKSTLLKILSRVTTQTEGEIKIKGRIASLLEVGTGFHPELTGRENIFLNGAILGMTKAEIRGRFDEIVSFAEIEQFIDTPVKRYSSGMHVRLAFAVAAHLEPEILLVDEVLAVGDVAFQKKCIGKMGDVAQAGRTVLFVSHNMGVIRSLCRRGVVFRRGRVHVDGQIDKSVAAYLECMESTAEALPQRTDRRGSGITRLMHVQVTCQDGTGVSILTPGRPARFRFTVNRPVPGIACTFTLYDMLGVPVVNFNSHQNGSQDARRTRTANALICDVDRLLLCPGRYRANVQITVNGECADHIEAGFFVDVQDGMVEGRRVISSNYGHVCLPHRWTVAEGTGGFPSVQSTAAT